MNNNSNSHARLCRLACPRTIEQKSPFKGDLEGPGLHIHIAPQDEHLRAWLERIPSIFEGEEGETIRRARNELRILTHQGQRYVVKSFAIPNALNTWVYGNLRSSKAQRSFEYALLLRSHGIGSPRPVAWMEEKRGLRLRRSFYVSLCSQCPFTYEDLMSGRLSPQDEHDSLLAIGATVAQMHRHGLLHRDLSRGNILLGRRPDGNIHVELIDLNRIRFRRVSVKEGLKNLFERLPGTPEQHALMQQAYLEETHKQLDA